LIQSSIRQPIKLQYSNNSSNVSEQLISFSFNDKFAEFSIFVCISDNVGNTDVRCKDDHNIQFNYLNVSFYMLNHMIYKNIHFNND
jgi:hypothetical protein